MSWDVWKLFLHVLQNCKKWGLFKLLKSRVICKGAHQDETLWFLLLPRERRERFEGVFFNGYSDLNFSLSMSWFRRTFPYNLLVMQHEVTEKAGIYAWYLEQVKMSNKVWCGANPVLCVLRCRWSVPVLGEAVCAGCCVFAAFHSRSTRSHQAPSGPWLSLSTGSVSTLLPPVPRLL